MREKKKQVENVYKILQDVESEKSKYWVEISGRKFIVYPKVFSPKYFKGTEAFAIELPVRRGEEFLEVGCGTGIVSIFALWKGASRAVLTDISLDAVRNARENIRIHGMKGKARVLQGDVFDPLEKEKFDTIFWNPPFSYTKKRNLMMLERAVFDSEYKSIKKFIREARKHLKPSGRLIIGFSPDFGHIGILKHLLHKAKYKVRVIKEMQRMRRIKGVETYPVKFQILEAKPRQPDSLGRPKHL